MTSNLLSAQLCILQVSLLLLRGESTFILPPKPHSTLLLCVSPLIPHSFFCFVHCSQQSVCDSDGRRSGHTPGLRPSQRMLWFVPTAHVLSFFSLLLWFGADSISMCVVCGFGAALCCVVCVQTLVCHRTSLCFNCKPNGYCE